MSLNWQDTRKPYIHRHISFSTIAPHFWNDLPVHLRATGTLHVLSVTSRPTCFLNYYGRSSPSPLLVSTSRYNFMRLMTVIFRVLRWIFSTLSILFSLHTTSPCNFLLLCCQVFFYCKALLSVNTAVALKELCMKRN